MCGESCNCESKQEIEEKTIILSAQRADMKIEIYLSDECTGDELVDRLKTIYLSLGYAPSLLDDYFK